MGVNNPTGALVAGSYPLYLDELQSGNLKNISLQTNTDGNSYDQLLVGFSGMTQVPNGESVNFVNNAQSSSSANYNTPMNQQTGTWYNTSTGKSNQFWFTWQGIPGTGSNPSAQLRFGYGGTTGAPTVSFPFTYSSVSNYFSGVFGGTLTANRTYNFPDISTNAMVGQVATSNLTGQTANLGQQTLVLYATAGMYRASCYVVVTTAATTSSTLPNCDLYFTDGDTGVAPSYETITTTSAGNAVGTTLAQGTYEFNAQAGTAIKYATVNYASNGAAAMQYAVHVRLEYLGQ
jgi:hypothetical protein